MSTYRYLLNAKTIVAEQTYEDSFEWKKWASRNCDLAGARFDRANRNRDPDLGL